MGKKTESEVWTHSAGNTRRIPLKKYTTDVCTWRYVQTFWVKRSRVRSFISFRKKKFIEKFRSTAFYQLWRANRENPKAMVARTDAGYHFLVLISAPGASIFRRKMGAKIGWDLVKQNPQKNSVPGFEPGPLLSQPGILTSRLTCLRSDIRCPWRRLEHTGAPQKV